MDLLTHAIVGAACAQIILGKKNNRIPVLVGALGALAPDLDLLIHYFSQQPLSIEYWHRNFSHSFIFIPLAGLIVALILMMLPLFRGNWLLILGAAIIGVATHGILDACTSYGTVLYWPWSETRVNWDIISIVDPLFTIVLCLGTAWSIIFRERTFACISLVLGGLFLLFNAYQHQRALDSMQSYAQTHQLKLNRVRAIPSLGSSTSWRVIAEQGKCLLIANVYTPLQGKNQLTIIAKSPIFSEDMLNFALSEGQKRDLAIFTWFTDGYLVLADKNRLYLADGRYTFNDAYPIASLWSIRLVPNAKQAVRTGTINIKESCESN